MVKAPARRRDPFTLDPEEEWDPIPREEKTPPRDFLLPRSSRWGAKYPWETLERGESFIAPLTARNAISHANKRYAPRKFKATQISPTECRIWRDK